MQIWKKKRTTKEEEWASTKLANGMGVVMNEKGLEGWKMQKHVQVSVDALAACNVNEEQVQVNVEVGETSTTDFAIIEVDLQKIMKQ